RVGKQGHDPAKLEAYFLRVTDKGAWSIIKSTQSTPATLASGTATALGTTSWHTLTLTFKGATITASIDGAKVGSATDSTYPAGQRPARLAGQTPAADELRPAVPAYRADQERAFRADVVPRRVGPGRRRTREDPQHATPALHGHVVHRLGSGQRRLDDRPGLL